LQDRGPAAYLAEFVGTLLLVLFVTAAVSLFLDLPDAQQPAPFVDWSVIGLVHVLVLLVLIQTLAVVSGAHFNPAVTAAMLTLRQIKPPDALIYVVAQFAGGIAGALIVKLLLTEDANADLVNFGATLVGDRLDGKTGLGMLAEFIGTFMLVFAIVGAALNPRIDRALAPLVIGGALGLGVMVMGPLSGAGFNPARSFGPALVSGEFGGAGEFLLVYFLAPVLGAVVAALAYFNMFITPGAKGLEGMEPVG
jgi:glycerol uptake facilitator protein